MIKIQRGSDPFKKYWWVLLVVFGVGGAAVCLPSLSGSGDASGGGSQAASEDGLRAADGSASSLDSSLNPAGAPGGAINLAMDGSGRKAGAGADGLASSLYQASEDAAAPADAAAAGGAAQPAAPKRGLADALRDISRRGGAGAASADASGWGGQKAQRGFTGSGALGGKSNFGGLSGLGGGSSSGARFNAEAPGGFGGSSASNGGRVGVSSTRGLQDDGSADGQTRVRSFNNLRNVNKNMLAAARSGDLGSSLAMGGRSFDGGGAGGSIGINGGGQADGAVNAGLTAAPSNLKVNDPDANTFKFEPVPLGKGPTVAPDDFRKQMIKMLMTAAVMGVMGMALGGAGAMLAGPMMQMMEKGMQQTQPPADRPAADSRFRPT